MNLNKLFFEYYEFYFYYDDIDMIKYLHKKLGLSKSVFQGELVRETRNINIINYLYEEIFLIKEDLVYNKPSYRFFDFLYSLVFLILQPVVNKFLSIRKCLMSLPTYIFLKILKSR